MADAHDNLGVVLSKQGKLDEAMSEFRQAIPLEPNLAETHYNLGIALRMQNHYEEAFSELKKSRDLFKS